MHERGYDAVWIELEVVRLVLVAAQRQQMLLRLLALFLQRDAHLLRTDRIDVVVELEHLVLHRRRTIRVGSAPVRAAASAGARLVHRIRTLPAGAYAFTTPSIVKEDEVGLSGLHGC